MLWPEDVMVKLNKLVGCLVASLALTCTGSSLASVVMLGNRVIYPSADRAKALKFTNNDAWPYLMQIWADNQQGVQSPEHANAPFILSPSIFKISPHESHVANLIFTGDTKNVKREQLYYLHFTQLPAVKASDNAHNKLLLMVTNTLKIFLRPDNLAMSPQQALEQLTYKISKNGGQCYVALNNNTPYYFNSVAASLSTGTKTIELKDVSMVPPDSTSRWTFSCSPATEIKTLTVDYVNDYGAVLKQAIKGR
jgi:P pilus assembly chaperone PapD